MGRTAMLGGAVFLLHRGGMLLKPFAALAQRLIVMLQIAQLAFERSHFLFTTPPHHAYLAL